MRKSWSAGCRKSKGKHFIEVKDERFAPNWKIVSYRDCCDEIRDYNLIALTPGEPAGIGPDLVVRLGSEQGLDLPWLVVGNAELIEKPGQRLLGVPRVEVKNWQGERSG